MSRSQNLSLKGRSRTPRTVPAPKKRIDFKSTAMLFVSTYITPMMKALTKNMTMSRYNAFKRWVTSKARDLFGLPAVIRDGNLVILSKKKNYYVRLPFSFGSSELIAA